MVVVEILTDETQAFLVAHLLEFVGRQLVQVNVIGTGTLGSLARPLSERIRVPFYLTVVPLVPGCVAQHDGNSPFLLHIHDELTQIPAEGIDHLIPSSGLHLEHLALITCSWQLGTCLPGIDRTCIVMTELYQHKVTRTQRLVHFVPTTFVQIRAGTAACLGMVLDRNAVRVKQFMDDTSPPPHAVGVVIGILHRTVAHREKHRTTLATGSTGNGILLHRLQITCQLQPLAGPDSLSSRLGIDTCSKLTGMDTVDVEHILDLLFTELLKLTGADFIQVNERDTLFPGNLLCP